MAAGVILLVALGVRLGYNAAEPYHAINDAGTYNRMASMIATYGDYHVGDAPKSGAGGSRGPTAYFPPAFPYYLAIADLIDGHEAGGKSAVAPERVEMAVTGTIGVALLGLVALEAFGEGVALAAMGLAAVYPVFLETSGILAAENLVVPLQLAAAYAVLRAGRARGAGRAYGWIAATGILTGLAALAHQNAILYVIPFGIAAWLVVRRQDRGARPRLRALSGPVVLVALTCLMIAPWTIRNAVQLHTFVPISDETGITLAGTYNPRSADDPQVPYKWHLFSHVPQLRHFARESNRDTEPQLSSHLTTAALDYITAHPLAPIAASADNTLRMFELEGTFAWHASTAALNIHEPWATIGVYSFYALCLMAIAGMFTRRARRAPWWLWLMPILWWISIVPINVETPRFREPIDPFLILLAAAAVAAAVDRLRLGRAPVRRRRRSAELAPDQTELIQMVQRLA
ncbi:MAG TPA: glycosyltransferase family 39 protein [Solirubrobacteraceae bacterium]|nr:glycosyltransferase family 39 protein [Solirubrobacteraceae bacterium]